MVHVGLQIAVQGETNGIGDPFRLGGMAGGIASINCSAPEFLTMFLLSTPSRRQNGEDIGGKCPQQIVVLSARTLCFEIEAISASCGFDRFGPLLRRQGLKYRHIPVPRLLALSQIASNLEGVGSRSMV